MAATVVGFRDLTLSAVAAQVGVSPSALYSHVRDRDDLVALAVEQAMSTMTWPDPGAAWRDYLKGCARSLWDLLEEHDGLAATAGAFAHPPPAVLRRFQEAVLELRRQGFGVADAVLAVGTVLNTTVDSFGRGAHPRSDAHEVVPAGPAVVTDEELIGHLTALAALGPRTRFLQRVDLVLDGVAQLSTCPDRLGHIRG